jgi:hypothetical protein
MHLHGVDKYGGSAYPPQIDHGESEYRIFMSKFHARSAAQHLQNMAAAAEAQAAGFK